MAKKKRSDGFNLAFLDVMACGLGAVLLILILVKFNEISPEPPDEVDRLRDQLQAALDENTQIRKQVGQLRGSAAQSQSEAERSEQQVQKKIAALKQTKQEVMAKLQEVTGLKSKPLPPPQPQAPTDTVKLEGAGEQNYLLGLKVEGKRIGILLDMSGSMVEESLPRAILAKNKPAGVKRSLPKWQRTLRVAKWLLARLPQDATVSMVAFNNTAQVLGGRNQHTVRVAGSVNRLASSLNNLVPANGTNLMAGLRTLRQAMPKVTDVYLVTDGLPTLIDSTVNVGRCDRVRNVSGECRARIFQTTISQAWQLGPKVNVILMPLEGDVQAPFFYWNWSARSRGMVISPAGSWP